MQQLMKTDVAFVLKKFIYEHRSILTIMFILLLCFDSTGMLFADTGVGDAIDHGANELLNEFARVYCGSLAYLFLAIEVVIFLISKNDKAKQGAIVAAVGTVVAYVVLKVLSSSGGGVIGQTMDEVTTWAE